MYGEIKSFAVLSWIVCHWNATENDKENFVPVIYMYSPSKKLNLSSKEVHLLFKIRLNYIFTIGKGTKPWVSLPEGKGIRMTVAEERDKRIAAKSS